MKVNFGHFEEVRYPDVAKENIKTLLEAVTSDKFTDVYVAYPHMLFSEKCAPPKKSKNQLEVYIFSIPKEVGSCTSGRTGELVFFQGTYKFQPQQRDTLLPEKTLPSGYSYLEDEMGIPYAIQKDNQLWILIDIFHRVDSPSHQGYQSAMAVIQATVQQFIHPLSPEEKAKIMDAHLKKAIVKGIKQNFHYLETDLAKYRNDLKAYEERYQTALKNFLNQNQLVKSLKLPTEDDAEKVLAAMRKMPFVDSIKLLYGNNISVNTKEVTLGPFAYGKWRIDFNIGKKNIDLTHSGKNIHPYEHSGRDGHFCMGGFSKSVFTYYNSGHLDKALAVIRMLITNFAKSTEMHPLPNFLEGTMGKKNFNEAFEKLVESIGFSTKDFKVNISSIMGNEITLLGSRFSGNSKVPENFRKVVKL